MIPGGTAYSGGVLLPKNWREVVSYIRKLGSRPFQRAVGQSARVFAAKLKRSVQQMYDSAPYRRHAMTLMAYSHPPRGSVLKRTWGQTSPLKRSGTLRDSVIAKNRGHLRWYVGPHPRKLYTSGDPQDAVARGTGQRLRVAEVAYWMEYGNTYVVRATPAMMAYLRFLSGRKKQKEGGAADEKQEAAQKKQGDAKPRTFVVNVPPKPVYAKAVRQTNDAFRDFSIDLWRRIQIRAIDQQRPIRVGMTIEGK